MPASMIGCWTFSRSVSRVFSAMGSLRWVGFYAQSLGWRRKVNAKVFGEMPSMPQFHQICRFFAAIWP